MENNIVKNADVGLTVDAGVVGVLEHGNVFSQVKSRNPSKPQQMRFSEFR